MKKPTTHAYVVFLSGVNCDIDGVYQPLWIACLSCCYFKTYKLLHVHDAYICFLTLVFRTGDTQVTDSGQQPLSSLCLLLG